MLDESFSTYSEDELRTKIVFQWLKDCGFSDSQIKIEYTIKLRIGRSIKNINSRSDVLVRSADGTNLLLIEIKKPSHALTETDVRQGTSYACCLAEGDIAPYTIITNGIETRIYDSITKQLINADSIPSNHLYTKNGFKVTGEVLTSRGEALEYLVTLSNDNLQSFCEAQVNYHMKLLSSDDLFSGKKYIPALYLDRKSASYELENKIFPKDTTPPENLLLVVGPPQHGKTCFVCHNVKKIMGEGYPCLFYPAVSLRYGLLKEIQNDFEWSFQEQMEPFQIVQRLNNLVKKSEKKLFIFIDGWNELAENAFALNYECNRLEGNNICIILSTTSSSLKRLLKDPTDNTGYIADKTKLSEAVIQRIETEPLHDSKKYGIIQIDKFRYDEIDKAVSIYAKAFNTIIQENNILFHDPFYLRLAAEQYSGSRVPQLITQVELVNNSLIKKGARQGLNKIKLFNGLKGLAIVFFRKNRPLDILEMPGEFNSDKALEPWVDSAILLCFTNTSLPRVDFYYTHDLNYSIAILYRKWDVFFATATKEEVITELKAAIQTEAGKSALYWFFSCGEFNEIIKMVIESVEFGKLEKSAKAILSNSIFNQVFKNKKTEILWIEPYLENLIGIDSKELEMKEELPQLVLSLLNGVDPVSDAERFNRWLQLLISLDYTIDEVGVTESFTFDLLTDKWGELTPSMEEDDSFLKEKIFHNLIYAGSQIAAKRASLFCSRI